MENQSRDTGFSRMIPSIEMSEVVGPVVQVSKSEGAIGSIRRGWDPSRSIEQSWNSHQFKDTLSKMSPILTVALIRNMVLKKFESSGFAFQGLGSAYLVSCFILELKALCMDSVLVKWSQQSVMASIADAKTQMIGAPNDDYSSVMVNSCCQFMAVTRNAEMMKMTHKELMNSAGTALQGKDRKWFQEAINKLPDWVYAAGLVTPHKNMASFNGDSCELWFGILVNKKSQSQSRGVNLEEIPWKYLYLLFSKTGDDETKRKLLNFGAEFVRWVLGCIPTDQSHQWYEIQGNFMKPTSSWQDLCNTQSNKIILKESLKGFWKILLELDSAATKSGHPALGVQDEWRKLYLESIKNSLENQFQSLGELRRLIVENQTKKIIDDSTSKCDILEIQIVLEENCTALIEDVKKVIEISCDEDLMACKPSKDLLVRAVLANLKSSNPNYTLEEIWKQQSNLDRSEFDLLQHLLDRDDLIDVNKPDSQVIESLWKLPIALTESGKEEAVPRQVWTSACNLSNIVIKQTISQASLYNRDFISNNDHYDILQSADPTGNFLFEVRNPHFPLLDKVLMGFYSSLNSISDLKDKLGADVLAVTILNNIREFFDPPQITLAYVCRVFDPQLRQSLKEYTTDFAQPAELNHEDGFFKFAKQFCPNEELESFESRCVPFKQKVDAAIEMLRNFRKSIAEDTQDFSLFEDLSQAFSVSTGAMTGFKQFALQQVLKICDLCTSNNSTQKNFEDASDELDQQSTQIKEMASYLKCTKSELPQMFRTMIDSLQKSKLRPNDYEQFAQCFKELYKKIESLFSKERIVNILESYSDVSSQGIERIKSFESKLNDLRPHNQKVFFSKDLITQVKTKIIHAERDRLKNLLQIPSEDEDFGDKSTKKLEEYAKANKYRKLVYCMKRKFDVPAGTQAGVQIGQAVTVNFEEFVSKIHTLMIGDEFKTLMQEDLKLNKTHAEGDKDIKSLTELEKFYKKNGSTKLEIAKSLITETKIKQEFSHKDSILVELLPDDSKITGELGEWIHLYTVVSHLNEPGKMKDILNRLVGTVWDEKALAKHIKSAQEKGIHLEVYFEGYMKHTIADGSNELKFLPMEELQNSSGLYPKEFQNIIKKCQEIIQSFKELNRHGLNPEMLKICKQPSDFHELNQKKTGLLFSVRGKNETTMEDSTTDRKMLLHPSEVVEKVVQSLWNEIDCKSQKIQAASRAVCSHFLTANANHVQKLLKFAKAKSTEDLQQGLEFLNELGEEGISEAIAVEIVNRIGTNQDDEIEMFELLTKTVNDVLTLKKVDFRTLKGIEEKLQDNQVQEENSKGSNPFIDVQPFNALIVSKDQVKSQGKFKWETKLVVISQDSKIKTSYYSMLFLLNEMRMSAEKEEPVSVNCGHLLFCTSATKAEDIDNFFMKILSRNDASRKFYILDLHRMEDRQNSLAKHILQQKKLCWTSELPEVIVFEVCAATNPPEDASHFYLPGNAPAVHLYWSDVSGRGKSTLIKQICSNNDEDDDYDEAQESDLLYLKNPVNLADKLTEDNINSPFEEMFLSQLLVEGTRNYKKSKRIHLNLEAMTDYHPNGYVFDNLLFTLVCLKEFNFGDRRFKFPDLSTIYIELNCNLASKLEEQFSFVRVLQEYRESAETQYSVQFRHLKDNEDIQVYEDVHEDDQQQENMEDPVTVAELSEYARNYDHMARLPYGLMKIYGAYQSVLRDIPDSFRKKTSNSKRFLVDQVSTLLEYPAKVLQSQLTEDKTQYAAYDTTVSFIEHFQDKEHGYLLLQNYENPDQPLVITEDWEYEKQFGNKAEVIILERGDNSSTAVATLNLEHLQKLTDCAVGHRNPLPRIDVDSPTPFAALFEGMGRPDLEQYAVNFDVILKAAYLLMMSQSRHIPVIMRGESGCGKTSFVQFLSKVSGIGYHFKREDRYPGDPEEAMIKIHSGLTRQDILSRLDAIVSVYNRIDPQGENHCNWIFFDEFNTTPLQSEILDIMMKRRYKIRRQDKEVLIPNNVMFLAACNPHKISKNKFLEGSKATTHRVEMTHVNSIPFLVDFYQFTLEGFKFIYRNLVKSYSLDNIPDWPGLPEKMRKELENIIKTLLLHDKVESKLCDILDELHKEDAVLISLRDVSRMLDFLGACASLYIQDYPLKDITEKNPNFLNCAAVHSIYTSLLVGVVYKFDALLQNPRIQDMLDKLAEFFSNHPNTKGICVRYMETYHSASAMSYATHMMEFGKQYINKDWNGDAEAMVGDGLEQEGNATESNKIKELPLLNTLSLMQNLFVMLICLKLGAHCFVYGKAGTGKTKSFLIIQQIMKKLEENFSDKDVAQQYKPLLKILKTLDYEVKIYAGSTKSTPEIVAKKMMGELNQLDGQGHRRTKYLLFFDEMGQADLARALKSFNHLLDEARKKGVVVIGISNTPLDQSIMNRMFTIQRKFQSDEVKQILTNNSKINNDNLRQMKTCELLSEAYIKYHQLIEKLRENLGQQEFEAYSNYFIHELRDLHACKTLLSLSQKETMLEKLIRIIEINFSGKWYSMPNEPAENDEMFELMSELSNPYLKRDPAGYKQPMKRIHSSELMKSLLLGCDRTLLLDSLSDPTDDRDPIQRLKETKLKGPLELIADNFSKNESRYLLVYTEDELTNQLLVEYLHFLYMQSGSDKSVGEKEEKNGFHVFRAGDHLGFESIAELRNALLKSNNCVVSINNEHMVFSTYDIANQKSHYSGQKYTNFTARLYLEENAQMLKVPGSLKLVFIKNYRDPYNEAFCSRFQKVHVRLSDFIDPEDLILEQQKLLQSRVSKIQQMTLRQDGTPIIQGLSEAMVFSLLFQKQQKPYRYKLFKEQEMEIVKNQLCQLTSMVLQSPSEHLQMQDSLSITNEDVEEAHKHDSNVFQKWISLGGQSAPSCELIFTKSRLNFKQKQMALSRTQKITVLNTLDTSDQMFQESLAASSRQEQKLLVYAEFSKAQKYMIQIHEFVQQHSNCSVMVIYSLGDNITAKETNPFTGLPFCFSDRWGCRYIEDLSILTYSDSS